MGDEITFQAWTEVEFRMDFEFSRSRFPDPERLLAELRLTNEGAVAGYQGKLRGLIEQGAALFTSDFGEAAPFGGIYKGDPAGFGEHNLYPLRYSRTVEEATGEPIQLARAARAGTGELDWDGARAWRP